MSGSAVAESPSRTSRWPRVLLGYVLALAALGFALHTLGLGIRQLAAAPTSASVASVALACFLLLAHTLVNREAFVLLARACGTGIADSPMRRLWARSLLGKYVPGGVWQLLGRAWHMQQLGCPARKAWYCSVIEQGASLALCVAIALIGLCLLEDKQLAAALLATAAGVAAFAIPYLLPALADRRRAFVAGMAYAAAMPLYLAAYACLVQIPLLELATCLFAGTSAGMLAIVVPSGLGVREAVASMLSSSHGADLLTAMLLARLLTLGIEILFSTASWLRHNRRRAAA